MTTAPSNDPAAPVPAIPTPAKRKRRVWPFVVVVVVLVALIVGFFVADAAAKTYAQDQIKQKVVAALGVDPKTDVQVKLGGGSVLLQALSGKLSTVDVTIPQLAFGDLVGSATLHATEVPLNESAPLKKLAITYRVSEKNVRVLASDLSGMKLDSITLDQPEIVANASFSVFGFGIPVGLGLTPSASHGQLVFTPTSILVSGQKFTSKQLLATPGLGSLAKQLLKQQTFCVAQYLPKALTVTSVKVADRQLVLTISGDGQALGGTAFAKKGTCGA
jgi:LmeA-like phospholipid-binding